MAKRTVRRPRGAAGSGVAAGTAADESTLDAIFASIRTGATPWRLEELPAETGASEVLLSELDRLWQNPLPN